MLLLGIVTLVLLPLWLPVAVLWFFWSVIASIGYKVWHEAWYYCYKRSE